MTGNPTPADVGGWSDLAYEMWALLCNSTPDSHSTATEWNASRDRLRDRFHTALDQMEKGSPTPAYRPGGCWGRTIIREGTQPPGASGRRPDDKLAGVVIGQKLRLIQPGTGAADAKLAGQICELLNDGQPAEQIAERLNALPDNLSIDRATLALHSPDRLP